MPLIAFFYGPVRPTQLIKSQIKFLFGWIVLSLSIAGFFMMIEGSLSEIEDESFE